MIATPPLCGVDALALGGPVNRREVGARGPGHPFPSAPDAGQVLRLVTQAIWIIVLAARVPREDPPEQAQAWTSTPALIGAVAPSGTRCLRDLVPHREQQVAANYEPHQPLHDSAPTSCSTLGEPASPSGVE